MFLFSAAVLLSACLATDSIITIEKTGKGTKPDFIIKNGNLSININDIQKIIMKESQLENPAVADINWNKIYSYTMPIKHLRPRDIYRRHIEKTIKDNQRNLDSFVMYRKHNAPLSYYTSQSNKEPEKDQLAGRLIDKTKRIDKFDTLVLLRQHNEPMIKSAHSTQEPKEDNPVLISSQELANYEPLVFSKLTRVPSNTYVGLNNESISNETSLVSRPEPDNYKTSLVTKSEPGDKPTPKSNSDPPPVQNYESATYFYYQPEIKPYPKPKISNYSSVIFGPQPMLNYEPDNLQPANYDAPLNYQPVNYEDRPYEPRNDERQNYETSLFSNNQQTYESVPSKQLVYNYSHQSHLDNLRNEGEVEILDVIYDDDEHEAQIIEALNKQTVVMEKLANVIQNENRRAAKLSRGEKRFNELLNEIEEWNNKTSTTPKQKQQTKNATKVTPSIISVVDETEIRNALKVNPLVKRILKMAARKRMEYIDAAKKYYNITT